MDDPLKAVVDGSIGVNPVGEQEVIQRRALGDKRFDTVIAMQDDAQLASTAWVKSKTALRSAGAFAIVTATLLSVSWSIWVWVR